VPNDAKFKDGIKVAEDNATTTARRSPPDAL
jgi:hypothetical protein